jgi:hypothetical protein
VLLSLAIDTAGPQESCPSLEEIAGWQDGTLPHEAVERVTAHVARCASCYAIWFSLVEDADLVPERAPSAWAKLLASCRTFFGSMGPASFAAAGLAAAAVAFVAISFFREPAWTRLIDSGYRTLSGTIAHSTPSATRWSWGKGLGVRAVENPWDPGASSRASEVHEAARTAFGAGVRHGIGESVPDAGEWKGVLATLPAAPPACARGDSPEACNEINAILPGVGRWAVLLHFSCDLGAAVDAQQPTAAFWKQKATVLEQAGRLIEKNLPEDPFARFFADWRAEVQRGGDARSALCAREAALLSLGLD